MIVCAGETASYNERAGSLSSPAAQTSSEYLYDRQQQPRWLLESQSCLLAIISTLSCVRYGSKCWAVVTANWCTGPVVSVKNPWHDFVRNADVYHMTSQPPLSSIVKSGRLWTSCENRWECRRQPNHFWASSWELETSTWVTTYYLDEDHPRWSLFPGSGAAWSQRTGWESTSLQIDVFTLVVVHATIGLDWETGQVIWGEWL